MITPPRRRIRVVRITSKEIAEARGVRPSAVNRAHCRGQLDLTDLKSIARYVLGIRVPRARRKLLG